mgnify:CR=1 FL=1
MGHNINNIFTVQFWTWIPLISMSHWCMLSLTKYAVEFDNIALWDTSSLLEPILNTTSLKFNFNRTCLQYCLIAVFHWSFQKYSVKIIYAINDWVCPGFPKRMHCISSINGCIVTLYRYHFLLLTGRRICTQLVFDLFICPAVIDPMLYGLTSDVTVSHIARHNLMQVTLYLLLTMI